MVAHAEQCAVCLDLMGRGTLVLRACGHCFCARCLLETLQGASSSERGGLCPLPIAWRVPGGLLPAAAAAPAQAAATRLL